MDRSLFLGALAIIMLLSLYGCSKRYTYDEVKGVIKHHCAIEDEVKRLKKRVQNEVRVLKKRVQKLERRVQ